MFIIEYSTMNIPMKLHLAVYQKTVFPMRYCILIKMLILLTVKNTVNIGNGFQKEISTGFNPTKCTERDMMLKT